MDCKVSKSDSVCKQKANTTKAKARDSRKKILRLFEILRIFCAESGKCLSIYLFGEGVILLLQKGVTSYNMTFQRNNILNS